MNNTFYELFQKLESFDQFERLSCKIEVVSIWISTKIIWFHSFHLARSFAFCFVSFSFSFMSFLKKFSQNFVNMRQSSQFSHFLDTIYSSRE